MAAPRRDAGPAGMSDSPTGLAGRRILITGGLGFIGSNLAHALVQHGAEVALVDALVAEHGANRHNIAGLEGRVAVHSLDLRDGERLGPVLDGIDTVFNLAGQTSHLDSMNNPRLDLEYNCAAQLSLLEACRRHAPAARIVFASTRQIYGKPHYLPVDETHPLSPVDINGVNKLAGEYYHRLYSEIYGIPSVSLRLTNIYGPRMRIKDARQTFLGTWIRCVLTGAPIEVWGGEQLRDLVYVDDAVSALIAAVGLTGRNGGIFNVGGTERVSLRDLANQLIQLNGAGTVHVRSFPEDRKKIDIGDYYADSGRLHAATGWQPQTSLEAGLRATLAYFRTQLEHYLPEPPRHQPASAPQR